MFNISNSIYKTIIKKYPELELIQVRELLIPFSKDWKNVGVNLSGGADSAALCLLLAKIISENNFDCKIHVLTFIRCWKTRPWQEPTAEVVYNKLRMIFPDIIVDRYVTYIPPEIEYGVIGPIINGRSGDQIMGSSFNQYISYKHNLDAVFNATSKNPKAEGFENRMQSRDKNAEDGVESDLIYSSDGHFFCHPFKFVQKDWIVAQFFSEKMIDLFNSTRSCEGDINDIESIGKVIPSLKSYVPGMIVPTCGTCFWCMERNWSLSKLERVYKVNEAEFKT